MGNTEVKRKTIPKKIRQKVYEKYDGHCSYCGCKMDYKEMQVDHVEALYWYGGSDDISNYMPACRMCNFYKSTMTLEKFRERLQTITDRLEKEFIYRLAKNYGIIIENQKSIVFYFEKCKQNEKLCKIVRKLGIDDWVITIKSCKINYHLV